MNQNSRTEKEKQAKCAHKIVGCHKNHDPQDKIWTKLKIKERDMGLLDSHRLLRLLRVEVALWKTEARTLCISPFDFLPCVRIPNSGFVSKEPT